MKKRIEIFIDTYETLIDGIERKLSNEKAILCKMSLLSDKAIYQKIIKELKELKELS